jgi:hypothetical protein
MSCTVADRLAPESMRPRHVSAIFFSWVIKWRLQMYCQKYKGSRDGSH